MLFKVLNKKVIRRKLFIFIVLAVFLAILCFINFNSSSVQHESIVCFFSNNPTDHKTLVNILEAKTQPSNGRNIFFHETSCSFDNIININARQACAVESAGKVTINSHLTQLVSNIILL